MIGRRASAHVTVNVPPKLREAIVEDSLPAGQLHPQTQPSLSPAHITLVWPSPIATALCPQWQVLLLPKGLVRTNNHQAHRIITQVVFSGARIIGRAVAESYRQASATQKYAAATQQGGGSAFSSSNITMDEACKILNVGPSKMGQIDMEFVTERFKRLFDLNEPKKGGSFYLQSKILRARERIEREVQGYQRMAERERELQEGFKPKITKD
jgi:import inner membrane translocase subunit TIM16